ERPYIQRNFSTVTVNWRVVQYRVCDDVGRGGHGGEVTERGSDLFLAQFFSPCNSLLDRIVFRRRRHHGECVVGQIFPHDQSNPFWSKHNELLLAATTRHQT